MIADRLGDLLRMDAVLAGLGYGQLVQALAGLDVVLSCQREMRVVGFLLEQGQQRFQGRAHIADDAELDRRAAPDVLPSYIHLRDANA
jgi:hypothetical protein